MTDSINITIYNILKQLQPYSIAFSGGNDSALLVLLSKKYSLDFCAVHCITEFTVPFDTQRARDIARTYGIRYYEVEISLLSEPCITANTKDRCYYCKKKIFANIKDFGTSLGYTAIVDGSNSTDRDDYRPGIKALQELRVISPFIEAGLHKHDIINELSVAGVPLAIPNSCYATRIPYNTPITKDIIDIISTAETFLHSLGFTCVRVRYHFPIARIEVLNNDVNRLLQSSIKDTVISFFKELGFLYVTVDLEGYQVGSLNRVIVYE